MGLWLILILILLLRANRKRQAWLILVPLLAIDVALFIIKTAFLAFEPGTTSDIVSPLVYVVGLVAMGLAWVLSLSHTMANGNRLVSFLRAAVIMAAAGVLGMLFSSDFFLSETTTSLFLYGVTAPPVLLGIVLAAIFSRKRFTVRSFMLRLPLWMLVVGIVEAIIYATVILVIVASLGSISASQAYPWALLFGLALGFVAYLVLLPFMVFIFVNTFYRDRFYAILRLKGMRMAENRDTSHDANVEVGERLP